MTISSENVGYVSVPIKLRSNEDISNSLLSKNINTVNNNGNASISSQFCQGAKYAFTAGVGILAVASVTYAATHGFFSFDFGTGRGYSGEREAKGALGLEVINQLNQGKTPDQISPGIYKG